MIPLARRFNLISLVPGEYCKIQYDNQRIESCSTLFSDLLSDIFLGFLSRGWQGVLVQDVLSGFMSGIFCTSTLTGDLCCLAMYLC